MSLSSTLPVLCIGLFVALLLKAAYGDYRSYIIPNRLNLAIAALFVPFALVAPAVDPLWSVAVGAAVLGAGIVAFGLGWFGGGDVKLLAAVSLWAGPDHLPLLLVATALAGGLVAVAVLCRPLMQRFTAAGAAAVPATRDVPYGIAISIGGIAVASQLLAL